MNEPKKEPSKKIEGLRVKKAETLKRPVDEWAATLGVDSAVYAGACEVQNWPEGKSIDKSTFTSALHTFLKGGPDGKIT